MYLSIVRQSSLSFVIKGNGGEGEWDLITVAFKLITVAFKLITVAFKKYHSSGYVKSRLGESKTGNLKTR